MRTSFAKAIFNLRRNGFKGIRESKWIKWLTTGTIPVVVGVGVLPYVLIYWAFLPEWLGRLIVLCIFMIIFNSWFLLAPAFKWGLFRRLTDQATIPTKSIRAMIHFLRLPVFVAGVIFLWVGTRPLVVGVFSLARGESTEKKVVRLKHIRTVGLAHHVYAQNDESYLLLYGPTMPGNVPYEFVLLPNTNFVLQWKKMSAPSIDTTKNDSPTNN
jgi:hypothetical protein